MSESDFLFDTNVWLALAFAAHPNHARAVGAYQAAMPDHPACFCRSTEQSLLRLLTTPAILRACGLTGLSNRQALEVLNGFLAAPAVAYRDEPAGIVPIWHGLAALPSSSPKIWMDAYLAAFAIAGGMQMVTFDRGFGQFAGLKLLTLDAVKS